MLDNLSVHKPPTARAAIEAVGGSVPSLFADLTPIDHLFSKVKAILRQLKGWTYTPLLDALAVANEAITPADAGSWVLHSGYRLLPSYS